jgi:hypothetical protein
MASRMLAVVFSQAKKIYPRSQATMMPMTT